MITEHPVVAVLDDEPEMRKALRRLLASRGFQVEEYDRGEEFLAVCGSQPLHCVLLDLQMPGLNGFEVLEALCARSTRIPVIVITAHDEPGTAERALALGASAYLTKPVDRDVLFSAIAEAKASTPKVGPGGKGCATQ
jgi:FixJ family two-component response regulator